MCEKDSIRRELKLVTELQSAVVFAIDTFSLEFIRNITHIETAPDPSKRFSLLGENHWQHPLAKQTLPL